jgi:hypothetical protein
VLRQGLGNRRAGAYEGGTDGMSSMARSPGRAGEVSLGGAAEGARASQAEGFPEPLPLPPAPLEGLPPPLAFLAAALRQSLRRWSVPQKEHL